MKFDQREWVYEIATGSITGLIAGAIGALFVPDPPFGLAMTAGGISGLFAGLLPRLIRALLNWLLGDPPENDPGDSK